MCACIVVCVFVHKRAHNAIVLNFYSYACINIRSTYIFFIFILLNET